MVLDGVAGQVDFSGDDFYRGDSGGGNLRRETLCALSQVLERRRDERDDWDGPLGKIDVLIKSQRGGQRGERQLIDTSGAHHRVANDSLKQRPAAKNDAALR